VHETTDHLLTKCNYMEAVWNLIAPRFGHRNYAFMAQQGGPLEWVAEVLKTGLEQGEKGKTGSSIHLLVDDLEGVQ
jgi:hypothetical protein